MSMLQKWRVTFLITPSVEVEVTVKAQGPDNAKAIAQEALDLEAPNAYRLLKATLVLDKTE